MNIALKTLAALLFLPALYAPQPATAESPTEATATTAAPLNKWHQLYLDRVELFRAENEALEPGARPIVFAGDSLTQHMRVAELYPGELVLNRGIASDGTAEVPNAEPPHYRGLNNRYEESILNARPRVLFILMGTNDVGRQNIELTYWASQLEAIIDRVQTDLPDCQIVLQTLPPSGPPYARVESLNARAKEYNELLKAMAERKGLPIIDLWELYASPEGILPPEVTGDGLHIKREAYERWAAAAREYFAASEVSE